MESTENTAATERLTKFFDFIADKGMNDLQSTKECNQFAHRNPTCQPNQLAQPLLVKGNELIIGEF